MPENNVKCFLDAVGNGIILEVHESKGSLCLPPVNTFGSDILFSALLISAQAIIIDAARVRGA